MVPDAPLHLAIDLGAGSGRAIVGRVDPRFFNPSRFHVVGGGAQNAHLNQATAQCTA